MIRIPSWAKKPVLNTGEVVATEQGWVHKVEGKREELLVRVIDLPDKLAQLKDDLNLSRREVLKSLGATEEVVNTKAVEVTKPVVTKPKAKPKRPPARKKAASKSVGKDG